MNLTAAVLLQIMPRAPRPWLEVMAAELPDWDINTPHEVASFVAQVSHESNDLTHLEENLNYSAGRLAQVWARFARNPNAVSSQRIPNDLAYRYEHHPEALANYIYSSVTSVGRRLGNGDERSGDGWRFHGRGPIQITGRNNYEEYGLWMGVDLVASPELLLTPQIGMLSAIWYWRTHNLDVLDDDEDVRLETRRINGGETGLAHRQAIFDRALKILEAA